MKPTTTRTLQSPSGRRSVQAAYAAGAAAAADEDAATTALLAWCRDHGAEPGDPLADAWCCGWYEARHSTAH